MKKIDFWKMLAIAVATICLAVGCSCETNGASYQYKGGSFTDTYRLRDDGTYKREYKGPEYDGIVALEEGTYETSSSSIYFTVGATLDGKWPSEVSKYYWNNSYSGTLNTSLSVGGRTYEKYGNECSSD